ncbi:hypothetical protein TNCV_1369371 [Trichonephila clavipes]|nr:hypothetical protein TNCV_1369371 [Trichonephila clavipes]
MWIEALPSAHREPKNDLEIFALPPLEREHLESQFPSDEYSAVSNNSDTDDEDYVENVSQGETTSDDEEIDEIQYPSTSPAEVKWG